jgi:signal transduction histidine kinase
MNKQRLLPSFNSSIFSKLLATMLGTIAILILMVAGFFAFVVFPSIPLTSQDALKQYTHLLALSSPSLESAKKISTLAHVQMRYQGPLGGWATSATLPSIQDVKEGRVKTSFGRHYYLEPAPQGGTYLILWNLADEMHAAHIRLLWMLLILIVFVVLAAYWIQRGHLRPVRSLSNGMTRISGGDLDVVLPVSGEDEFAQLTAGFNNMVARVKQMVQARDQLLLDVSHELRSPLTRIKVALALMPDDADKAGIDSDLNEMELMISELLELERFRSPNALHRTDHNLMQVVQETARTYSERPPGVRVTTNANEIPVNIDTDKIRTVLRNLLENAFKYSLLDSDPVDLSVECADQAVIIRVHDDGVGIPENQLGNLFEPFFRVDPSRSKKTGGYGLGLSICKRIVEAHGGTIEVEKGPGRGTSFILSLRMWG